MSEIIDLCCNYLPMRSVPNNSFTTDIHIRSLTNPHDDLPADMEMFGQLIFDGNIFLQTVPLSSEGPLWILEFDCRIPQHVPIFSIAIMRHSITRGTRLLGSVKIPKGQVLSALEHSSHLHLEVTKVNPDGPCLEFTGGFSMSRAATTDALDEFHALQIQGYSLDEARLKELFDHNNNSGITDSLELWVLHERILLLSDTAKRALYLTMLGNICFRAYNKTDRMDILNHTVCVYRDAVRDELRGVHLINLGNALLQRFLRIGDLGDLDQSVVKGRQAATLAEGDPDGPQIMKDLGHFLLRRFKRLGDRGDIDESVSVLRKAIALTQDGTPAQAEMFTNLGRSLCTRFERLRYFSDMNEAIWTFKQAIALTPEGHPQRPLNLDDLGHALYNRFEQLGNLDDIQESVSMFNRAVTLTPANHPDRARRLNNFGNSLRSRFNRLGDPADIEQSVEIFKQSVILTPDADKSCSERMSNLGNSVLDRFHQIGDLVDLNNAVIAFRRAITLTPDGHPRRPMWFSNLGDALFIRFEQLPNVDDINESVELLENSTALTPDNDPEQSSRLYRLGRSLLCRFDHLGDISDLRESTSAVGRAVTLTSDGHPARLGMLQLLGHSLTHRFEHLGDLGDIHEAVLVLQQAVSLASDGHQVRHEVFNALGISLRLRFTKLGDIDDIDEAVLAFKQAIALAPNCHAEKKARILANCANVLRQRFERLGNLDDINESVSMLHQAITLIPANHADRLMWWNDLGSCLTRRFERLGNLNDINESLTLFRDIVNSTPDEHSNMPTALNNVGNSLLRRYEWLGDSVDIKESVSVLKQAVALTPVGDQARPARSSNLGVSLMWRFVELGALNDINEAISVFRDTVGLTPDDDPDKAKWCNNLGASLKIRFERLGDLSDLQEAVAMSRQAVSLAPEGHPDKIMWLHSLGRSLFYRFKLLDHVGDIDESVSRLKAALSLTPETHPAKALLMTNLGQALARRGAPDDHREAITLYSLAACSKTGSADVRFQAASNWARITQRAKSPSDIIMRAHNVVLDLLPELAWLGLTISDRHRRIITASRLVRDGAASAIAACQYAKAVEWLEQGRSIVWGQLLNLRTPVDTLREKHSDLAAQLVSLSRRLESAGNRGQYHDSNHAGTELPLQSIAHDYHETAHKREVLLKKIRALEGFDRFLLPKPMAELSLAAQGGPVTILNISEYRCDALVLMPGFAENDVLHVPLHDFTLNDAQTLAKSLETLVHRFGRTRERLIGRREGEVPPEAQFAHILSELWLRIAQPVLKLLAITTPSKENLPRMWWCPTGPLAFLPIHAAGLYGEKETFGSKLSDFVISSYTPSLTALNQHLHRSSEAQVGLQLLAVAQPSALGHSYLPGTRKELDHIERLAIGKLSVIRLEEDAATIENVEKGMRDSRWVHVACHGIQDISNPTASALLLAGSSRLELADIIKLSLPHADLAFLSACETATGVKDVEDESVHLAAGMLLAGYRGVIATMWSIRDDDAPAVAAEVYEHLFKISPPDPARAAEALHLAVGKLREDSGGNKSFFHWVPFIHVGV